MPMSIEKGAGLSTIKADTSAIRCRRKNLVATAAIDFDRIDAGAALVQIRVIPRVPDELVVVALTESLIVSVAACQRVVSGSTEKHVEAAFAQNGVVPRLTEEQVPAGAAGQRIYSRTSVEICTRQCAVGLVERDRIVAAQAEGLEQRRVGNRGRSAHDAHGAAVDENVAGRVSADLDRVVGAVAVYAEHAVGWGKNRGHGQHLPRFKRLKPGRESA